MDTDTKIAEVGGKTWAELEVVEGEDGHQLVRDCIREKVPGAERTRDVPVMVRIPRPMDLVTARVDARMAFAKHKALDADRDEDLFGEIEQLCILAKAIRTLGPPHAQLATWEELASRYEEGSIQEILGHVTVYRQMADPRLPIKTEDDLWLAVASVARAGHLGPLTGIAGPDQPSCVLFMARMALLSPTGAAWLQSLENSTQEPSNALSSSG
jgi:hypothetical protein